MYTLNNIPLKHINILQFNQNAHISTKKTHGSLSYIISMKITNQKGRSLM